MYSTLDRAIDAARSALPIKASVTAPEYMDGFKITRYQHPQGHHTFHVYDANAWEKPTTTPLLPYTPPLGEIVATMDTDGTATRL